MPLQDDKSRDTWVKVTKIYINSDDREVGDVYSYKIKLNEEIQYVVGMELTSYNLPTTITPSFTENTKWLDFSLTDGSSTSIISVEWPMIPFVYSGSYDQDYMSYVDRLPDLLNAAMDADPVFGAAGYGCSVFVTDNTDSKTQILFSDGGFDAVTMTLLFDTGPNAANSSYKQMGFERSDYSVYSGETIISPNPVELTMFRYVDINVEEARELKPLARIYRNNNQYSGIATNEVNITRTRLLSSEPIRSLRYLTVKLTLVGGISPPISGQDPHDLGFTIFSVGNENGRIPRYLTQTFIL